MSILSPTFISPRQPPSFTPRLLTSRVCARWLSLLPAIQTRTGTTDLVLGDCRLPIRNRDIFHPHSEYSHADVTRIARGVWARRAPQPPRSPFAAHHSLPKLHLL